MKHHGIETSQTVMNGESTTETRAQASGSVLDGTGYTQPSRRAGSAVSTKSGASTRTMINFWLDTTMLIVFVLMLWSATIVRFVFPPAVTAKHWTLWSWTVDQWIGFHYATLCLFTFLVVLHLMLHWSWVCGVLAARFLRRSEGKKRSVDDGTRTLWGVGLLIVLLNIMGLAIALAVLTIHGPL